VTTWGGQALFAALSSIKHQGKTMSIFMAKTQSAYVENMRKFLRIAKVGFLQEMQLVHSGKRIGRAPRYAQTAVNQIEVLVNQKALRVEAIDTSLGERIKLARDYAFKSDTDIGRNLKVSRELVRRWGLDLNRPTDLPALANELDVPYEWLASGGEMALKANSTLGVRVGAEALMYREKLLALTRQAIVELNLDIVDSQLAGLLHLEKLVFENPEMASLARKAGGRWLTFDGTLVFAPWVPIQKWELTRRKWSDDVEAIIEEELGKAGQSVYKAWAQLCLRCKMMGLAEDEFPRRITLFKRVNKERNRTERFGVNLHHLDVVQRQGRTSQETSRQN
jgi:hypothetical protein